MSRVTGNLAGIASVLVLAIQVHSAQAQDKTDVVIDRYTCRELLRESGSDRDVAIAFLHGYILGKTGTTTLNVETLRKQSAAFVDRCIDSPQASALATMLSLLGAEKLRSP